MGAKHSESHWPRPHGYEHGATLSGSTWTFVLLLPPGDLHSASTSGFLFLDGRGEVVPPSDSLLSFEVVSGDPACALVGAFIDKLPAFCCSSSIFCKYLACSSIRSCNCLWTWWWNSNYQFWKYLIIELSVSALHASWLFQIYIKPEVQSTCNIFDSNY